MPIDREKIFERLNALIPLAQSTGLATIGEITSGTITLLETLYGPNSEKLKAYLQIYQTYVKASNRSSGYMYDQIHSDTLGILRSIKSEVEAGLVGSLELQVQGGIFGDFIVLARKSLEESKDVAAVLVSAALEDALKRVALQNNLDVADADMERVINALTSKGLLKGPQASIVKGHKQLRTKAFHANWNDIDKVSVSSAIAFTESFILENFTSN